ncbi:Imm31 family immunity protein [Legionella fairfieldensis]|uniref:Imm31 family immunity protein n=1 Tax=Legionella fairfieldensis TaxID=45064 RepID=UPI00048D7640|nr:Imm31 family immunity protein [Legionella fairfieldensis]
MRNKKNKFELYDVVEVISNKRALRSILGKKGIVRGISQSEEDPSVFAYAIDIPASKINWFIFEADLKETGKKVNPEQVETGSFITVDKNGENL